MEKFVNRYWIRTFKFFKFLRILIICLGLTAYASEMAHAGQFSWQPLSTTSEPVLAQNMITNSLKENTPCSPAASDVPIAQTPPEISLFATVPLDNSVVSIAWSPDQKYLAAGENLGARIIEIFNFPNLTVKTTIIKKTGGGGQQVAFTHDGKYLITTNVGIFDGVNPVAFSLIDINTGAVEREIPGFSSPILYPLANVADNFVFSPDGKYLFAEFSGDGVNTYAYQTSNFAIVSKMSDEVSPMAPGPGPSEMTYLAQIFDSADAKKQDDLANILIWNGATKTMPFRIKIFNYALFRTKVLSVNMSECAIAVGAGEVDTVTQQLTQTKKLYTAYTAIQNPKNAIKIWYPNKHNLLDIGATTPIQEMSYSPKAPLLAYIDGNNDMKVLFLPSSSSGSKVVATLGNFQTESMDLAFSPDGRFLAAAGDSKINIYKIGD